MQVKSKNGSIRELRGRIGNFIFRTRNNKIFVFYKPTQSRSNTDPMPVQLREIMNYLNLDFVNPKPKKR